MARDERNDNSTPPPASPGGADTDSIGFTLVKGKHTWRFECARGEEHTLIEAVAKLARSPGESFDAGDAALIVTRLSGRLGATLHDFASPPRPDSIPPQSSSHQKPERPAP
ncbi:MAG TPA: hypothetical protein VG797_02645 [Phycisphaerales bacterium]|nr:hypothetical protein [Phycisphaerales bacterium]